MKMPKVATWIKADGELVQVVPAKGGKFSLEEVQEMVGGYVERVKLAQGAVLLVNEEGIPIGLPPNARASGILGIPVVGDVVIVPRGMGW